jgi:hypothetical protein
MNKDVRLLLFPSSQKELYFPAVKQQANYGVVTSGYYKDRSDKDVPADGV